MEWNEMKWNRVMKYHSCSAEGKGLSTYDNTDNNNNKNNNNNDNNNNNNITTTIIIINNKNNDKNNNSRNISRNNNNDDDGNDNDSRSHSYNNSDSNSNNNINPRSLEGGVKLTLPPSIFLALKFCSLIDCQKLWHNCSLFVNTSFNTN